MFQLERLTVVKETLVQIFGEMCDDRIETTDGMIPTLLDISNLANAMLDISNLANTIIPFIEKEKKREQEAWNDENS